MTACLCTDRNESGEREQLMMHERGEWLAPWPGRVNRGLAAEARGPSITNVHTGTEAGSGQMGAGDRGLWQLSSEN